MAWRTADMRNLALAAHLVDQALDHRLRHEDVVGRDEGQHAEILQVLERGDTKDRRGLRSTAETIVSESKRLSRLVDDLQDVSYIQSGRFVIEPERFDIVALAREIIRSQQATSEAHYLILRAPDEPIEGEWDRDRIAQAFINLLSNAIKYSPKGGKVIVTIEPQNDVVDITVQDQGIGIARQDFPLLFRPYSQLYRRQTIKGTGLGLYITIGIVKAHHGSLWVNSEVGKGTAFHISLPRNVFHQA
jgi:signal transduction histidine kinase